MSMSIGASLAGSRQAYSTRSSAQSPNQDEVYKVASRSDLTLMTKEQLDAKGVTIDKDLVAKLSFDWLVARQRSVIVEQGMVEHYQGVLAAATSPEDRNDATVNLQSALSNLHSARQGASDFDFTMNVTFRDRPEIRSLISGDLLGATSEASLSEVRERFLAKL